MKSSYTLNKICIALTCRLQRRYYN